MTLKMVTALVKGKNSSKVGQEVAREAKRKLATPPAFALLYTSTQYDLKELLKAIREELGNIPLIGCTTGGEITNQQIAKQSVALALFSQSDHFQFHVAMDIGLHDDPTGCIQRIVDQLPKQPENFPYRSAILLHDGLAGRGEEAVLSAATILGPEISFAGGSAGDDLAFKETFVFCNDKITKDSAAICIIDSKSPAAVSVQHGHKPLKCGFVATKAIENVLYEINGKPAWSVWKETVRESAKALGIDVDQLKDHSKIGSLLIRYELGLDTGSGYKIRAPLSKNEDDSLNFGCTILEGAKFCIMESPKQAQLDSAEEAAKKAIAQMKGREVAAALVFDCVCRAIILGDDFAKAITIIQKTIGKDVPLIGFETYGEICRIKGKGSGFHNTTTVIMLLPAE
ncbi:MAG: FIST N-terminal domain-containing protein [Pseudomonadota bacterium]|nr:FIST C-terminal domain-containing protein [Gammaproteobacteria bacterium]MBU1558596.1 FIST C-terminal domain-containing protein [Gammaproteobacteria bacterium]MBU1629219.1 FIST C-terminal domain-containing protein [Gammaproteobacteria bacterium]MBU1926665.1 FIST C-terminal domain-containing protein [Gammaproteobacteria bacterium]MBU2545755.1 FIST C-terminal domain-containing protein [Gammaproteobacteria bacterium]